MFGVSSGELGLIFIVALVLLGPARLPGLVRKIGRWVGKARSMARDFQQQLENEVNLQELNRMTDIRAAESSAAKPSSAAETSAAPKEPAAAETGATSDTAPVELADSGYPYGPQEPADKPPQPGDDTFSHAHAQGELPMGDPPAEQVHDEKKDSVA
jgi:sec-independent protein translocase protein TatB